MKSCCADEEERGSQRGDVEGEPLGQEPGQDGEAGDEALDQDIHLRRAARGPCCRTVGVGHCKVCEWDVYKPVGERGSKGYGRRG